MTRRVNKHQTEDRRKRLFGSNSSLVAPVSVGIGAYVASGSVITSDVPDDALALGRARQETKRGRAKLIRERIQAIRAALKAAKG